MSIFKNTVEWQKAMSGENGSNTLVPASATTTAGVLYCAIHAWEDSVITANKNGNNAVGDADFGAGLTILAGDTALGIFDEIDVTSGKVEAYLAKSNEAVV